MQHETWLTFQNEVSQMDTVNMSVDGVPPPFAANAYLKASQFFNIGSQEAQEAASAEGKSLLKGLVAVQHEVPCMRLKQGWFIDVPPPTDSRPH